VTITTASFDRIRAGLEGAIDRGTETTAQQVKDTRDPLTPVDTGELLASGRIVKVESGHWQFREGDGIGDARAIWTEWGTGRMPAQPHVTPAVEQNRANLAINVAAEVRKLVQG
jgi:HK97 gp10 family phage protein